MQKSPEGYVRVTALPAAHGDALWVEYGRGRNTYRLLIDGGPASTYAAVRAWLEHAMPAERRIELFVVTHIDADHIDGAILLLQQFRELGLRFDDVWFNGWRHLQENAPRDDVFAPNQGEFLGALIEEGRLPWNAAFRSAAVVVPETGPLPRYQLPDDASLTLVSPQQRQLRRLRRNWDTVARDAGWSPGDTEGARDRLSRRRDYVPPPRIDVFGGEAYKPDNSVANGSSIAFVFEYGNVKCLFTGDAVTDCLANGLERLAAERETDPVHFDLVKLPHHGSAANVDKRLAELMPADRFLISTNGARYHHPDADAIKLVLERSAISVPSRQPQLYFNYQSKTTEGWGHPDLHTMFSYGAFFPSDGPGITVTLGELFAAKPGGTLFEPFDFSVVLGPGDTVWVSAVSRAGAVYAVPRGAAAYAVPGESGAVPTLGELEDLTDDFLLAIADARPQPAADLGAALRNLLFGEPEILALFHHARGVAASEGRQLLVRLLAAPRSLASVPWELTLDPDGGLHQFLSLAPYAHLVRSARSRTYPDRSERLTPPLNLLVVLSSPIISERGDDFTFDLFEEKRNLLAELQPLEDAGLLNIDVEEHPTLENLRYRVRRRRYGYHLVHYVGHAVQRGLLLEDRFGRSRMVEAEILNELLRLCPNLRLVLFAGCETARAPELDAAPAGSSAAADWRVRLSMADRCVRDSCPMVIGMQAVLPFRTEWLFTRCFYQAVTTGYSVAEAVRLARVTIRDDEYVGGSRLDWAVPSLIVGGGQPDVLVEPIAAPPPRARRRGLARVELKLDLVESDLDFFSRLVPLRLAVDVLTGSTQDRVLVVTGGRGVGKTRLIDRVLEDIGDRMDIVLYVRSSRLIRESGDADLVMALCRWVAELLNRTDDKSREPAAGWDGRAWWDRLLHDLTGKRFVIVLDDVDRLTENPNLSRALSTMVRRRGQCRLALVGSELPAWLLDEGARERAAFVRLTPFTWDEVWRWIRRNHPVLTRYGIAGLAAHYPRLGSHLELWGQVAELVATSRSTPDLEAMVNSVAPRPRPVPPQPAGTELPQRGLRPLRVAIAGPYFRDPHDFAVALTNYAADNNVGGRALVPGDDTSSTLGILLPIPSPFRGQGQTTESEILRWLDEVEQQKPDIVVLDYQMSPEALPEHRSAIRRLAKTALVVAAAGNTGDKLTYPARDRAALAVGALSSPTRIADHSPLEPRRFKPDIYASETLDGTALKIPVYPDGPDADSGKRTSFAAYLVAAAAILVWAIQPEKDPGWVRTILHETATELPSNYKRFRPRAVNVDEALNRAREDLVTETLRASGRLTLPELLAGTGLPALFTDDALRRLVDRGTVARSLARGAEAYELIGPLA